MTPPTHEQAKGRSKGDEMSHPEIYRQVRSTDERGATTVEWLMWAAVVVVAIAAIGVALRELGIDVVQYVGNQIMG